jgi:hypothetical protein
MSRRLESLLDGQRRADCAANDTALACCTHRCYEGRACPDRHGTPTVRRHPRTMADAFPDVRANAIEPHEPFPMWKRFALFLRRRFA